jgi:phosphatidylglycerophosphate synthase
VPQARRGTVPKARRGTVPNARRGTVPRARRSIGPQMRTGPAIGIVIQVALLAILDATVGLGAVGWITGVVYGLAVGALLSWGLDRTGGTALGPADWVTLTRAILVGCVTALVADRFIRPIPVVTLVGITIAALVTDAIDGQVARRTHTVSAFGARFDMEVDAYLILVLSVYVARSLGWWVLAIGAMRYAYVAAGWVLPWLRRQVPPRFWRKVVAAVQGIVLLVATSGLLPEPVNIVGVACALLLLIESFGRDVVWQYQWRTALSQTH